MQQPLLAFNNVEISYDDEAMIQGVSLKMNKGEILGIVGDPEG
jgi:ABC-type glutathione transport system ATPase component